ncbi:MAG: hypothetical protein J5746_12625 [Victivallales bacterium]|nr:hypothetical protein [Victivallales bacterium]
MKKTSILMALIFALSSLTALSVERGSSEILNLKGADAEKKAHGIGRWLINETSSKDEDLELKFRFWHDEKTLTILLKDIVDSAEAPATWEIHAAQFNDRGDLLVLTVGPGAKVSAKTVVRKQGGTATKTETPLPEDFASATVKFAEQIRTIQVSISMDKLTSFGFIPGKVCFMNVFYLKNDEAKTTYGWNPTGKNPRTAPWCLGRVYVLK